MAPLAELEAELSPLVQSCVFPKLVSTSENVRRASAEAEERIDVHNSSCRYIEGSLSIEACFFLASAHLWGKCKMQELV